MEFRTPLPDERPQIKEIIKMSFSNTYAYWADRSFDKLETALAAVEGGSFQAVIDWRVFDLEGQKIGYLFWLAVHPDHRRKGLGMAMMQKAIGALKAEPGLENIFASVEQDNAASIGMLVKLGFTSITRAEMRRLYGKNRSRLYRMMWVMPWEDVYCIRV